MRSMDDWLAPTFAQETLARMLGVSRQSVNRALKQLEARGALRLANTNDWTRRNFVRWMFEDEPRAAIFTPSRWHRGFLKRPGVSLGSSK